MPNLMAVPTFFARRLSSYVPAMTYAADVNITGEIRVSFGTPVAAGGLVLINAQSVSAAGNLQAASMAAYTITEPFGRALQVVLSAAGSGTVIVDGYDYLNQPMSENVALNGTTVVQMNKAFKSIRQVTWPLVGAVTMTLSVGTKLGLPYKCYRCISEEFGTAPAVLPVSTLGTMNNFDTTVPATATTGDTRGTYTPQSTLNGVATLTAGFTSSNDVDSSNNGGLHGVPHYTN